MTSPFKLTQIYKGLTAKNQLLKRKLKLGTNDIPIPPKRDDVTAIEAINRFNKANPRVDTTNIQPVVNQSTIKQSNVGEIDEGVIQGAFDTATMEARDGGYPVPIYESFKKRYLKRNMKADGGRAGYEDGGMLVQPSDDGSRPGYREYTGPVKKLSTKEVQALYKDLPDNVSIMVQKRGKKQIPEYTFRATVSGNRLGKENWSMNLKATPENKKTILKATEDKLNEYYPKRLDRESYAKLRLKPENRRLRGEDFAKKLNMEGYTTSIGGEWNRSSVYNFDLESPRTKKRIADDLGFFEKRTVKEAKEIIKKFSGGKHFLKNKNLTDADITTRAAEYVAMEKFEETSGTGKSWPRGKQNKRKVWTNIYNSHRQGGRFKLVNEKELADADGKVNWKKDLNWRKAKFKDTKSGKIFTYTNLEKMVDKHGGGYQKAVKAYNDNAILNQTTFKGKTLNSILTEGLLKKEYETLVGNKVRSNDAGLLKYISEKKPYYSFVEAHHIEGVKDNPFKTEPAFRYANRRQGNFQVSYDKALKSGNPNRIAKAKETYIQNMNQLSDEMGGIRYKMDNKFIGKKGTTESIVKAAGDVVGMTKNKQMQIIQNIQSYSKLPQCKVGAADGGRIGFAYSDECVRDGLKEQKIQAQKGNKKAAQELVQVGKVATRAGLLKNLLGPGAILGEAVFEGAVIGNKVLGGKELDQAWAESYLSYLDPRKYSGQLDSLKMSRDAMTTRKINDQTIDGPNANILRSGFAAQDQVAAFNEAVNERERAKSAGRLDQYNPAAADAREQGRFVDQSKDIISSDAFQDATKQAQEYIANKEAKNRFDLGVFGTPQGELSEDRRMYKANKAMNELFTPITRKNVDEILRANDGYTPYAFGYGMTDEGKYNEDLGYKQIIDEMDKGRKQSYFADNFRTEKAGGGIAGLSGGDPKGAMTRSMNPDSQGLSYLFNRVKKV